MTSEEINKLEAGREIDALIAEKVMGWAAIVDGPYKDTEGRSFQHKRLFVRDEIGQLREDRVPSYSTDIAAAWQVVEKMETLGYWCQMQTPTHTGADGYWCGFAPVGLTGWPIKPLRRLQAEKMPLAICKAALMAMEERKSR